MKFVIKNLGIVASAALEFNGITAIVGDNNTGKTTIGKALYTLFTSFSNMEEKISDTRRMSILREIRGWAIRGAFSARSITEDDLNYLLNRDLTKEQLFDFVKKFDSELDTDNDVLKVCERIMRIRDYSDDAIKLRIIEGAFEGVFDGQFKSKIQGTSDPHLELHIKDKLISVDLGVHAGYEAGIDLVNDAYFLQGTDVLKYLGSSRVSLYRKSYSLEIEVRLARKIEECFSKRVGESETMALSDLMTQEDFNEIVSTIDPIVNGQIILKQNGAFAFDSYGAGGEIRLSNMSEGLKTFALLQLIVKHGLLKNKDVLILDEPEVHLHPEWQMKFAEIIVLLQKHLDLTILLTTHSSDFIYALQLYAKKYKIEDKMNAYKSEVKDGKAYIDLIKDSDEIYARFANVISKLDDLEEELRHG